MKPINICGQIMNLVNQTLRFKELNLYSDSLRSRRLEQVQSNVECTYFRRQEDSKYMSFTWCFLSCLAHVNIKASEIVSYFINTLYFSKIPFLLRIFRKDKIVTSDYPVCRFYFKNRVLVNKDVRSITVSVCMPFQRCREPRVNMY